MQLDLGMCVQGMLTPSSRSLPPLPATSALTHFWFLSIFTHSFSDPLLGGRHWFGCEYYIEKKDIKPCPQEFPCLVGEKMRSSPVSCIKGSNRARRSCVSSWKPQLDQLEGKGNPGTLSGCGCVGGEMGRRHPVISRQQGGETESEARSGFLGTSLHMDSGWEEEICRKQISSDMGKDFFLKAKRTLKDL